MKHINMLSGGLASWATGKVVAKKHGVTNLLHLFTDTCWEDEDLYRFLPEAVHNIGGEFVRIADGRTPWQVFHDVRIIGNTQIDPCSKILKRKLAAKWLVDNCDPKDTTVYVGYMWFERHRFEGRMEKGEWKPGLRERMAASGWRYEAPLIDPPYLSKQEISAWLEREGINPPRIYDEGFPHNNCGGRCVKQGQAGFRLLLLRRPESFAECERLENAEREHLGKNVSILRDRKKGKTTPLPLTEFRHRLERGEQCDMLDYGTACNCMFGEEDSEVEQISQES